MSLIMTKLLHALEHAPRPVLMAIPMIGVVVVSGVLGFLAQEGGQAAERQLARQHGPSAVPSARQAETALAQVHGTPGAGSPQR